MQEAALGRPSRVATEATGLSRRPAPAPAPATPSQAEDGSATATDREREEGRRTAEARERIEAGGATAVLGFSTLSGCLCFPSDAKRAISVVFGVCLFLAFATFLSGVSLLLLGVNMLGLRAGLISAGHDVAARCLAAACAALSVLTLLSLVALVPGGVYVYVGLAVVTAAVLPAAAAHWYLGRRPAGGGGGADAAAERDDERERELEAVTKVTSSVTNSAFGGLVGVLFSVSRMSGAAAGGRAAYAAIFFMFATAMLGLFVNNPRFRRLPITVIRLANAFLLFSLACAAFAAAFVVLRYRVFAAFAPLAVTGMISFLLQHCVARRGGAGEADDNDRREDQEAARLKAMEDLAGKVTTATFGGIMSVLGSSVGGEKGSGKTGATDMFLIALTSTFVSGFGFMLLAAAPGPAKARLAPAAKVLVWSSVALFAATTVAVYAVEVWTL